MFKRVATDGTVSDCSFLCDSYAGTEPSSVWIVGSGPSLTQDVADQIKKSGAPVCCINLGGRAEDGEEPLVTPDIFVAWDVVVQYPRSVFLNPRITKFLIYHRRGDLLPGGTEKACDCPNTYFVDTETRGYADFLDPQAKRANHSRDTLILAIDILFRLGFRKMYLAGTDMIIRPSAAQIQTALAQESEKFPVEYKDGLVKHFLKPDPKSKFVWSDRLQDFRDACERAGVAASPDAVCAKMEEVERESQYRCGEQKEFKAAVNTDLHYWTVTQMLRQSRRCLSLHGVRLVSCTRDSRLNDYFPYQPAATVASEILGEVGDPKSETCKGRLTGQVDRANIPYNVDLAPVDWDKTLERRQGGCGCNKKKPQDVDPQENRRANVEKRFREIAGQKQVLVAEEG